MDNIIKRSEIANGVYFSCYNDSKFKLNRIDVVFMDTLHKERASLNALIPAILSRSSNNYRTMRELNKKLSELYSANLGDYASKSGDMEYFGLYSTSLDDAYALDGESTLEEIVDLLKDCLFNPYLENGVFPEKNVEIQKQNLIDDNNNEINDKALYTSRKGHAVAYENEPAAISVYGENDVISKITPAQAYEHYLRILETKNVEIICVGPGDFSIVKDILGKAFASIKRNPEPIPVNTPSRLKDNVRHVTEKMDVAQSKLFLAFKTELENRYPFFVMSNLFGGDVSSKLFSVVREKLSLCYYCYSHAGAGKRIMTVECGVEKENIEKATNAILEQLEEIRKGNFTDEDIMKTKLSDSNSLRAITDRVSGISRWHLNCLTNGFSGMPEDEIELKNAVTREEIIEAAKSVKLDTVFVLTSEEAEAE